MRNRGRMNKRVASFGKYFGMVIAAIGAVHAGVSNVGARIGYLRDHPSFDHFLFRGRDVAELLHLPVSTVLEYARRGLLPGHKLGRRWIFLCDEIEAAVRSRPEDRSAA